MANKRSLKKLVNHVCVDIATECLIASEYVKGVDASQMDAIITKVADLQTNALANISFAFDKIPSEFANLQEYNKAKNVYFRKAYKSFTKKFYEKVNEIVKEMNQAIPEEVKAANKKAVKS